MVLKSKTEFKPNKDVSGLQMNKLLTFAATACFALSMAGAAAAAKPPSPPAEPTLMTTVCALSDIGQSSGAPNGCVGFYSGNLIGASADQTHGRAVALNALLGTSYADSDPFLGGIETLGSISGHEINFSAALFGLTVISVHDGGGGTPGLEPNGSGTAFYKFDAGNLVGGLDKISWNYSGLSNARLYQTGQYVPCTYDCGGGGNGAVPEPATWAMMILGFGAAGTMLRRRRALVA